MNPWSIEEVFRWIKRILICSDAPWSNSGYAVQVAQFAPALAALGFDVALLTTYGLQGNILEWHGLKCYPGGNDAFANDVIGASARDWQADIVITLKDVGVFNPQAFQGLRWCPLVPVDHDPIPQPVIDRIHACYRPIAYAPQGFRALRATGFDPLYCPHTYDPAVYNPQSQTEARQFLGLSDDLFIVGTVAVNRGLVPSRKAWPQNIEAFARFAKDKPNARYYMHTNIADDGFEGGVPIRYYALRYGCAEKILFCDQDRYKAPGGFEPRYMNAFYNAIDVLNAVSLGEGFGIPVLEAQAVGCPVIVGDWCAHEDLCFAGWKVRKDEALRFPDNQLGDVFIPYPAAIADRLEQAYQALTMPTLVMLPPEIDKEGLAQVRQELRAFYGGPLYDSSQQLMEALSRGVTTDRLSPDAHEHAIAGAAAYQIDRAITDHWQPALADLAQQIANEARRGVLRIVRPEEVLC